MASDPLPLGTRIRRARERARLSQEELAKAVGASKRAVGDWENDRRKPRNRLGAIEEVLGVRLDDDAPEPEPELPPSLIADIYKTFPDEEDRQRAFSLFRRALASGLTGLPERDAPAEQQRRRAG